MKLLELEHWAREIAERVAAGQPIEDSRVELKADWSQDVFTRARQLAAHANAANGEPVLWLIGIDEKKGVVGASSSELSNWIATVLARFDENVVPKLRHSLTFEIDGKAIVCLYFETDRAPYVVKTGDGRFHREIPWRSGNSTRSAHRSDLVRILLPAALIPIPYISKARLECLSSNGRNAWTFNGSMYIVTKGTGRASIPQHQCSGSFQDSTSPVQTQFESIIFSSRTKVTSHPLAPIVFDEDQLIIQGSGMVHCFAEMTEPQRSIGYPDRAVVEIKGPIAEADWHPLVIRVELPFVRTNTKGAMRWEYNPAK